MRTTAPPILPLFRSELQARLLAQLFTTEAETPASELVDVLDASAASVHRELSRLEGAGILERRDIGRSALYQVATDSPLYEPLKTLVGRTLGVEVSLRSLLEATEGVAAAYIFGSWAEGSLGPASDIDVLVVGDPDRAPLISRLRAVEDLAGREIDVRIVSEDEWRRRGRFLQAVADGPRVELVAE